MAGWLCLKKQHARQCYIENNLVSNQHKLLINQPDQTEHQPQKQDNHDRAGNAQGKNQLLFHQSALFCQHRMQLFAGIALTGVPNQMRHIFSKTDRMLIRPVTNLKYTVAIPEQGLDNSKNGRFVLIAGF